MNANSSTGLNVAGRILLSLIFLVSGAGKIADWNGTAEHMAAKDFPLIPLLLVGAIVFELVGGLSVATGLYARFGGLLLVVFLLAVTPIFHNFWALEGEEFKQQMIQFLKNTAILGGLLIVVARGSGPGSLHAKQPQVN